MKTCKVSDLFNVQYGNGFELNALQKTNKGINFVARGMKDNGVVAKVRKVCGVVPFETGSITVAASGSVMESFLQTTPFYTSYHIFVLTSKEPMSIPVKLYYCMCLRRNKFKYSYGRQANETLAELQIPAIEEIPAEIKAFSLSDMERKLMETVQIEGLGDKAVTVAKDNTRDIPLSELFTLHNGISSNNVLRSKIKKSSNWIPYIRPSYRQATSIDSYVNKGLVPPDKIFPQGTLYVSTNGQGSHTYSYVSASAFVPNSDVCVLMPKRDMCLREKLFYALCITRNRFKFSYGRKPKGNKLESLMLPEFIPNKFNEADIDKNLLVSE